MQTNSRIIKHRAGRRSMGGVSPILLVLLAVLIAAVAAFIIIKAKGDPAGDLQRDIDTKVLLTQTLADADTYFAEYGATNPRKLPPDPNAPAGSVPTAERYVYEVTIGDETIYVSIRVNIGSGKITAMHKSDADGSPL
ncbi:hypothetical protein JYU07_00160 [Roseiflexus sp. AH-315-K22]|nr:hypothetical protein [Roseiflexus sp. AH-315-K22]